MKIPFISLYDTYVDKHLKLRTGERHRRLLEGLGHAEKLFLEKVWFPAFDHFEFLHPEYEVKDFRDGTRFIDFAFIRQSLKLAIEIDGFTTHVQLSRSQFADQLIRQNHLTLDGWKILRFTYDDLKDRPRMCIQMLQQFMGRFLGVAQAASIPMNALEKEIIRLALSNDSPIKPLHVSKLLEISNRKSCLMLKSMCKKSLLQPAGKGTSCVRSYKLHDYALGIWEANHHVI
ncbi:hypothetical protein PAECIP111891_00178 [Paenibacillus allorhizoplanae]|uniref:DUF559 domain-containing protein n=1 Tax=Paenibacillus allorhizoplanae TaxID=2905648 RepID=A0ABN8FT92_9BACL|nr:endonuclease domain-containing protein [Paenibacillus allorhizoplanae]CAH1192030.1 hypothetical protein PAECIP111891_00178 [Paenibacillus allorhizoplanae]